MDKIKPGSLIKARGRNWIVIPSESDEYLKLKPFSGSELQTIAIPHEFIESGLERVETSPFPDPDVEKEHIGDYDSAQLTFLSAKFLLRNAAVPLRCAGNISIQPKPYQLVPLIVALRQESIRLLIADDVGVGKTIESLLIARELLDRGEINRVCVITPPQLCDQWEREIKDKFSIYAPAVKSSTIGSLEKSIPPDKNIFEYLQHFVTSIDLVKWDRSIANKFREAIDKIDLFIIDEAHGCAKPRDELRQLKLRYELVKTISKQQNKHIILLTAIPHSGITQSFMSLLGILDNKLDTLDPESQSDRRQIKPYLIQRTRDDIRSIFKDDELPFPDKRKPEELQYALDSDHKSLINKTAEVCKKLIKKSLKDRNAQHMCYYATFSILRCVSSSPDAAMICLKKKSKTERHVLDKDELMPEDIIQLASPNVTDDPEAVFLDDPPETTLKKFRDDLVTSKIITNQDWKELEDIAEQFSKFKGNNKDGKLKKLTQTLTELLKDQRNTIVWCRYISTAIYIGGYLSNTFPDVKVEVVTGWDPEASREEKIDSFSDSDRRVLVATDCISEGVNLQQLFDSVIHYDLPLNPNRLEQRAGRVDRFGQNRTVKEYIMYSFDNVFDLKVFQIIIKKIIEVKNSTGVVIPVPVNPDAFHKIIMDDVIDDKEYVQKELDFAKSYDITTVKAIFGSKDGYSNFIKEAQKTRQVFRHEDAPIDEIKDIFNQCDTALGTSDELKLFLMRASRYGFHINESKSDCFKIDNLTTEQKEIIGVKSANFRFTTRSPSPYAIPYVGRQHPMVNYLAERVFENAVNQHEGSTQSRLSVIASKDVKGATSFYLLRSRYVVKSTHDDLVEETLVVSIEDGNNLSISGSSTPFWQQSSKEVKAENKRKWLVKSMQWFKSDRNELNTQLLKRAQNHLENLNRVRKILRQKSEGQIELGDPPFDILGIIVIIPESQV